MKNYDHKKDFLNWHKSKAEIDETRMRPFFHSREIWWCSIGLNVGFEQDGKGKNFNLPVLIIKVFSREVFVCVPLTTKLKNGIYYHSLDLGDGILQSVILSQIRLLDSKRLQEKITTIDKKQFDEIKKAVIRLLIE